LLSFRTFESFSCIIFSDYFDYKIFEFFSLEFTLAYLKTNHLKHVIWVLTENPWIQTKWEFLFTKETISQLHGNYWETFSRSIAFDHQLKIWIFRAFKMNFKLYHDSISIHRIPVFSITSFQVNFILFTLLSICFFSLHVTSMTENFCLTQFPI